ENIDTGSFFEKIKGKNLIDICSREVNFRELGLGLDMTFESWQAEFRNHLTDLKNNQIGNKNVLCVILTGSASYMYFVSQIVKEVFKDTDIIYDMEPRNAIARGLCLTGPVREQAEMMHQELIGLENEVPEIINKNIDRLFDRIRERVTDTVYEKIIGHFKEWKAGKISTIQEISDKIKTIDIEPLINTEIDNWAEKTLVEEINSRAEKIFRKYSIPFKNDFQLSHISLGSNVLDNGINPYECIMNQFSTITGFIALGVIGLFVWGFFLLFSAFPMGLVFMGIAFGLFKLFDSENTVSEAVRNKILRSDIPMTLRNLITMDAIKEKISKEKISERIKEVFDKNRNENRKTIVESVSPIMKNILREKYSDVLYFFLNKN
ncbi:MAG: hypothetical protein KBT47_02770, partial [Armatimonadetes bacterium]|nr:hypothetical protein [Candidatus Hippobium faecium]